MKISKVNEVAALKIGGSVYVLDRMNGGGLQFQLAEIRLPKWADLIGSDPKLARSRYQYGGHEYSEVSFEKTFKMTATYGSGDTTYSLEEFAAIKQSFEDAYLKQTRVQLVRQTFTTGTTTVNVSDFKQDAAAPKVEPNKLLMKVTFTGFITTLNFSDADIQADQPLRLTGQFRPDTVERRWIGVKQGTDTNGATTLNPWNDLLNSSVG